MKRTATALVFLAALGGPAHAQISATPEIAAQLPGLGRELSREMVGGTMKLYGPLHALETDEGLKVDRDISYGPHERNVLDVFAPAQADGALPVMLFVHGGGFVRGDKKDVQNIGRWFARHGVVTVTMNYRFAPQSTWPSGAEDVKAALEWIGQNAAAHGGDPKKIFVAGNSAGAMHVADYAFREDLQAPDDGVIGAVIVSPPTADLTKREVDPTRDALYYGVDGDRKAQSVVNALEGRRMPVLVAYAENEPDVIIDQTRLLVEGLAARDGRLPLVLGVPGHNHISIVEHVGTADTSLATGMLNFIQTVAFGAK